MPASCFFAGKPDFDRAFADGRSLRGNFWRLYFLPNAHRHPRLGVVVQKRHIRGAVQRNRIRRTVREHFRQRCVGRLPAMDFLTQTLAPTPVADAHQARVDFDRLLFAAVKKQQKQDEKSAAEKNERVSDE